MPITFDTAEDFPRRTDDRRRIHLEKTTSETVASGGYPMGLDVALVIVVLILAIRGWLRGFVYQAVRLGGMVACVYLADPVRDQGKPYVLRYLPTIPAELMDRILWWVAAVLSYIVLVGATTLVLKMTKRPEIPGVPPQRSRNDQFAGFLLGIAKGLLVSAFLTHGIQAYALKQVEAISWAKEQTTSSWALKWDSQFHPFARIWASVPVQHLVNHIQRMGLPDSTPSSPAAVGEGAQGQPVVQTASRTDSDGSRPLTPGDDQQAAPPAPPESKDAPAPGIDADLQKIMDQVKAIDEATKPK
jgi:uncharacterized membrane protein required for colicin V production